MSQDQRDRVATRQRATGVSSFATPVQSDADRIIVTVRGQLVVAAHLALVLMVAKAIAAGQSEAMVDLEGLDSIDASDIDLLGRARSLLRSRRKHLVVRSPCSNADVLAACALLDPCARVERVGANEASESRSLLNALEED
jgi:anti-anti-sigma regulatory factor